MDVPGEGTWLMSNPKQFCVKGNRVFVAESEHHIPSTSGGIVWANRVRLIREATHLDLKSFGVTEAVVF